MRDLHITSPKGMNKAKIGRTLGARDVGMVTDGVSLKQGYKKVSPQGASDGAMSTINKSKNLGHKRAG